MTASNIRITEKWEGHFFEIYHSAYRPTLLMHKTCTITVRSPTDVFRFHAERQIMILEALKVLTDDAMPATVFLLPGGMIETRVHLPLRFMTGELDIQLYTEIPSALCIVVLSPTGIFVLRRESGMNVSDVLLTMNHNMEVR